jgi:hypothetical protein
MSFVSARMHIVTRQGVNYLIGAIFGGAMVVGIAVVAQVATTPPASSSSSTQCAIATAAQTNLNTRITMAGATAPDPSKYFTIGGVSSCIGAISNIDLSNLIPDPLGLLTSLAKAALNMAVQAACTAARQSLSDYLGKYNAAVGMTGGGANAMLSQAIGQQVGVQLTNYGTTYAAPPGSQLVINPLATVTGATNTALGGTATSATSGISSGINSVTAPANSTYQNTVGSVSSAVGGAVSSAENGVSSLGNSVFGSGN